MKYCNYLRHYRQYTVQNVVTNCKNGCDDTQIATIRSPAQCVIVHEVT